VNLILILILNKKSKIIKTNAYGMAFPHDILDETDVQKYRERIDRLKSIPQVDYVLDCTVNAEQKNALITLLPNMRRLLIINEKEQFYPSNHRKEQNHSQ
jgi:hypothetical protein